jgi:hypothetical protein
MIILEGSNGSGKTALAERLSRALDRPVYKFPTPKDPRDAVRNYDSLLSAPFDIILDRHPMISDWIYAPIMFPMIDPIPWDFEALKAHTLIYCRVPFSTAVSRHTYVKDDPFYRNEMRIYAEYDALFACLPHIKFDWTRDLESDLIAELRKV